MRIYELTKRNEIDTMLDELEYLFEVIPPDMHDNAGKLIALLCKKPEHYRAISPLIVSAIEFCSSRQIRNQ